MFLTNLYGQSIKDDINNEKFDDAFNKIFKIIQKEEQFISKHKKKLEYFNRTKYPKFYEFILRKNAELIKNRFFKEALRIYRVLSLFEKNDKRLYDNYKQTYVFYTNSILRIKKSIDHFNKGEIGKAKRKLNKLEKDVPNDSNLNKMVVLGKKEMQKRIYLIYIKPGIDRVNNYADEAKFKLAKAHLGLIRKIINDDVKEQLKSRIKLLEKKHYFNLASNKAQNKKFNEALNQIRELLKSYPKDEEILAKLSFYKEQKLKNELQAEAYNNLRQAELNYRNKNYSRAIFFYETYMSLVKNDNDVANRIIRIKEILKERQERKFFYENYKRAIALLRTKQYEKSLQIFKQIEKYSYEKEKVKKFVKDIIKELEKLRIEREKINQARNYIIEGKNNFTNKKYQEAISNYGLSISLLEEVRGEAKLKREARKLLELTRKRLKALETLKARERLKKIENGIRRGRREYELGNYDRSLLYLQEVISLDKDNVVAQNYLELVSEAQKINSVGKINERDPFFPLFVSLKREAEKLEKQGNDLYKEGKKNEGLEVFKESINKWQTIKRAFPYNELARKNIRSLYKFIDPQGWREAIKEDLDKAVNLANTGNKPFAYKIVKEIFEEAPQFPRIQFYLQQTKPKEKRKNLSLDEKKRAIDLYYQALGEFTRRKFQSSLKISSQILRINKYSNEAIIRKARSLYIKVKNRVENSKIKSPNLPLGQVIKMTKLYRLGLQAYQQKNYTRAVEYAKRALRIDPTYSGARSLLNSANRRLR